jgi:hypothetical protein
MKRSSGEKVYSEKLSKEYNRLLKYTMKQSVDVAITAGDSPFRRKSGHDIITRDRTTPGQTNHRQGYAGYHVGDVEKRREI